MNLYGYVVILISPNFICIFYILLLQDILVSCLLGPLLTVTVIQTLLVLVALIILGVVVRFYSTFTGCLMVPGVTGVGGSPQSSFLYPGSVRAWYR